MRKTVMQMSFATLELEQRVRRQSTLMKVNALINWEALRLMFKGIYKRDHSGAGGQEPFDCLLMFKAIVLGQWHSLSDAKLEEALLVRIDFLQFCGLSLSDVVPDETTLCRFRNRLVKANLLNELLKKVNRQIQDHGLMVKEATGAVLDATLISSAARPNKTITVESNISGEPVTCEYGSQPGIVKEKISKKRYIVEQCFGTGKRLFKMGRASYMKNLKVNAQIILKSICMNLTKAANKIFAIHPLGGAVRPLIG